MPCEEGEAHHDSGSVRPRNRRVISDGGRVAQSRHRAGRSEDVGRARGVLADTGRGFADGATEAGAEAKEGGREKRGRAEVAATPVRNLSVDERRAVKVRDGWRCRDCGEPSVCLTVHHVTPKRDGGTNDPANLITLCPPCHVNRHKVLGYRPKRRRTPNARKTK